MSVFSRTFIQLIYDGDWHEWIETMFHYTWWFLLDTTFTVIKLLQPHSNIKQMPVLSSNTNIKKVPLVSNVYSSTSFVPYKH